MGSVNKKDIVLLKAFVKREAEDFTQGKNNTYIRVYLDLLLKKVQKLKDVNFVTFNCYARVGSRIRSLMLDCRTDFSGKRKLYNYSITLCPCGNIAHTGFVTKEVKNGIRRKGKH